MSDLDGSLVQTAARVVVVADHRVLLVCHRRPDDGREVWLTPGGRVEDGESFEAAARRELREELGLVVGELDGPIWKHENAFVWRGESRLHLEMIFWVRLPAVFTPRPEVSLESESVERMRWWSVPELQASDATFAPAC